MYRTLIKAALPLGMALLLVITACGGYGEPAATSAPAAT